MAGQFILRIADILRLKQCLLHNNAFKADVSDAVDTVSAQLPNYVVLDVPDPTTSALGSLIYVTDESGGQVPAFTDGTNWRRVTDRAIIS